MIDSAIYVAIEQAIGWRARSNWDGNQQPRLLVPQKHELTTQEAANFLNVSRPFVIKEIEANRLKCRKVNRPTAALNLRNWAATRLRSNSNLNRPCKT